MSLHYPWPVIRTVDDVLPHIAGRPEFIHVKKDGYSVINYTHQTGDTFPTVNTISDAILRECRGLIFDEEGNILARRYNKFFNYGERADLVPDFSQPHVLLEKLDGSMISPVRIKGGLRWCSKMGITDTSMNAEVFVAERPEYIKFVDWLVNARITPIFEWCSRKNRIVMDYPEDKLVLTAVRANITGQYLPLGPLAGMAALLGIPIVKSFPTNGSIEETIETVRKLDDGEGIVIRFDDGHMVKVKSEWYLMQHRAKAELDNPRHALKIILEHRLDDYLPVVPPDYTERLTRFNDFVWDDLSVFVGRVLQQYDNACYAAITRGEFARNAPDSIVKSAVFKIWDTNHVDAPHIVMEFGAKHLLKASGSNTLFAKYAKDILSEETLKELTP